MKLDLNLPLTDLDDQPVPDTNLGKAVAIQLVAPAQGDILRHFNWAFDLNKGQALEVNAADYDYLRRFVESSTFLSLLAKKRILDVMDAAKTPKICESGCHPASPAAA